MKRLAKILCLILVFIFTLPLFCCKQKGSVFNFSCFNTLIHIETHDFAISDTDKDKIKKEFFRLENEFSVNKTESYTSLFNNAQLNSPVTVSSEFITVLKKSKQIYSYGDGRFNPSILPVLKLWQFSPDYPVENFILPTFEQIERIKGEFSFDLDTVFIDEQNSALTKTNKNVLLDFGGILKGYALDIAYDILCASGHTSGYISVGGSSIRILSCDTLGVKNPRDTNSLILSLNIKNIQNFAVSTSGVYERYYDFNGKTYSHIIDASTCSPVDTGILSATVLLGDGMLCDALSTALVTCKYKSGELTDFMRKIISDYDNAQIYVVYNDGVDKLIITNKKESENFTLLDKSYTVINT